MSAAQIHATVRVANLNSLDAIVIGRLVAAYLAQTEREKAEHLGEGALDGLPLRYRAEVDDPRRAYRGAKALLAERDGSPLGVAIVRADRHGREIKRLWVDPTGRGLGVGSALLSAAMEPRTVVTRLTVWDWRSDAIRLYARHGFAEAPSWDPRARLVCMEAPATA